jgi:serine/threonine protein kinase
MSTTRICPHCGHQQPAASPYCAQCGSPLPGMGTGQLPPHFVLQQGRYVILARVGMGGMGAVYRAADTRLGNKAVAIKEMSDAAIPNPQHKQQAIAAFRQEAQMLAHLDHPNLPKVTDFFTENGKHYIVMEFVEGETLESTLQRQRVGETQVRLWAAQLLDVLGYLHRQNPPVIFRDLKPANVMLTPAGQLKLIDFGIARVFKTGKPGDTLVMGTPGYAAPEQHGSGQTDARSDIYSLGVVLHQALTGYDPSLTPFVLPPVHQFNPSVSPQMEQAIARAIQTDRLQRFQSVDQFRAALAAGVTMPGSPTVKTGSSGGQLGKLAALVAGAAILLLIAFLVGRELFGTDTMATSMTPGAPEIAAITTSPAEPEDHPDGRDGEVSPSSTVTDTPVSEPTATPTSVPMDTPQPTFTATPQPTATFTPEPLGVVNTNELNLRRGTSSNFDVIRKLDSGDQLEPIGRNDAGDWLQVRTANGDIGWVASQYVDLNHESSELATVATPTLPSCGIPVAGDLAAGWDRSRQGCPTGQSRITWSAWQPFERGGMLWREDTDLVTVFYDNGDSTTLPDQWQEGTPWSSRGNTPPGRVAPVRGFGWIWGTDDWVFKGLGWGLDAEKGICSLVQPFERGFILRSTNDAYCNGNYNRANDAGFAPLRRSVSDDGRWRSF